MDKGIQFNENPKIDEWGLKAKEMDLQSGWLGKLFGSPTHSPLNIAGVLIFLLAGTGVAVTFIFGLKDSLVWWNAILPILTLSLGYIFGKTG